jgi:signal transduction histidine kinase
MAVPIASTKRLFADLGHELRTPLTVICGEIEAVLDGVHEPESFDNVVDEVELMDRLLEGLRTLALAEAGRLELVLEPTNLGDVVTDVVASCRSAMKEHGVVADVTISGAELVEVDPLRVHQVISNLVSNALRGMPDGGRLDVTFDGSAITVADTGPGIPEDQLPFVFDRWVKAPDSTGSGLSIARDLVEAHEGTITAGNRSGSGAVFQVELSYLRTSSDPPLDRCSPAAVVLALNR